jgi:hypothetical protein
MTSLTGPTVTSLSGVYTSSPPADSYGIKALIPLAVVIFLLGIAQGNSKLLRVIGGAIPGQLVSDRTSLLLKSARPAQIGEAWQYNDRLGNLVELNNEIDTTISRVPINPMHDNLSEVREMQAKSNLLASTADFVKGLTAVAILSAILLHVFVAWPIHYSHLAIVIVASAVILIYLAFSRIQAEREYASRKALDYNFQKKVMSESPTKNDQMLQSRMTEIMKLAEEDKSKPAWEMKFAPSEAINDLRDLKIAWLSRPRGSPKES